jgi:hypothetical protein
MSDWRVRRSVSDAAETVISFATKATNSVPHSKILLLGAFAALLFSGAFALLVVVAVPILSRADMPPNRTLKCYDSAGEYQPCVAQLSRADMPPMQANGTLKCYDSAGQYQPCVTQASASQSRLNDQAIGADQLASWTTTAFYQADLSANGTTSAPVARRSSTLGKRPALATCRRRLIPCFLSTLRKGLTRIASVAETVGQARPAREHL